MFDDAEPPITTASVRAALDAVARLSERAPTLRTFLAGALAALRGCVPGVDDAAVFLRDGTHLRAEASTAREPFRTREGDGVEGLAAAGRAAVYVPEAQGDPRVTDVSLRARGARAVLAVPLVAGGDLVGVARVATNSPEGFGPAERAVIAALSTAGAGAVALFAERLANERRSRMTAAVTALGHLALTAPSADELLARAAVAVRDAMQVPFVSVVAREEGGRFVARAVAGWTAEVLGATVAREGERVQVTYTLEVDGPVVSPDLAREARFAPSALRPIAPVRSSASVPIRVGPGEPFGALFAHATEVEAFYDDRVAFLEAFANVLGAALARGRETARLREREESLRLATEAASMGTWDWSPVTGALAWSPRTYAIYGVPEGAALSFARYAACIPAEDRAVLEATIRRALAGEDGGRYRVEHRIHREGDGAERWLVGHGLALFDAAGRPSRLIGTTVDVTAQVLAREQAEAARAALAEAVRAKDEFLAMLGHELRNPLAPIVTALRLMKLRGGADSRERDVIERQVRHLTRLVDDLLDVSRIAAGRVRIDSEILSVAELVARAVELASPLVEERRQRLAVTLPEEPLRVLGDGTRLAQVLSNLLTNAAKYTAEQGRIELSAAREQDRVVLRVRDDGIGISAELLPRVFDLFAQGRQSLDRARGGMGLGLAIVRSLVSLHGGSVEARSEGEGRGSEFAVSLPSYDSAPPPPPDLAPRRVSAGTRVLLVDDNVDSVGLLALALEAEGCAVETAHDGPTALLRAREFAPDAVVLDIGLPVMDGYELARLLRAEFPRVPLLALTGYGAVEDRERARAAGFDAHLVKPVDIDDLVAALGARAAPGAV